jgi:serine/threonine protein kinase
VAVLAALAVAHQKGIVHRDIKPQNVMLTNSGEIKVADFGIAHFNVPDSLTKTGVFMGTDGFVSPEQRANSKDVDVRADIYSVAALLYCSLVVGEAMPVLFAADLDEKILAGIPDPLAAVIKKATRYQREDRYFSAEEMMTALKEVMEKLPEVSADTLPLVIPREEEEEGVVSIPTLIPDDLVEPPLFVSEFLGGFGKDSKTSLPFDQGTGQRPWLKVSIAIATTVAGVTLLALIWQFGWFEKNQPEPVVITQSVEVPPKEVSVEPILPSQTNEVNLPVEIRPPSIPTISKPRVVKPEPLIKKEEIVPEVVSTAVVVETQVPEVAIVDQVPELVHDAPLVWPAGQTFTPEAKISSGDYRVKIYFRLSGARAYTNFAMVKDGEVWRASVPIEAGAVGFEYHIAAEPKADGLPKLSSGSGFKPHIVRVE